MKQLNTILDVINAYETPHPKALATTFDAIISGVGIYETVMADGSLKDLESISPLEDIKAIRVLRLDEGTDRTSFSGKLEFPFTQDELENCLTRKAKHKTQMFEKNNARSIMPKLEDEFYYMPDDVESLNRSEILSEVLSEDDYQDVSYIA